jgi:predicted metalloprotease
MRLGDEDESSNVEDRRGRGGRRVGGVGLGTIAIALVVSYFTGIDPRTLLGVAENFQNNPGVEQSRPIDPGNDAEAAMKSEVARVLHKTETSWNEMFGAMGGSYVEPRLVLFRGQTSTACGTGQAAMGPFYCPGDSKVYLDMGFFDEMAGRFRAGGDFARAYVIAHEIGHHVQNLLGVSDQVQGLRQRLSREEYNQVSVRVELQADCFAGLWAQHANRVKPFLDAEDIDEALRAANAIGDDMLQKQARGVVIPDSFTHGTSAQRVRWFKTGYAGDSIKACDTFKAHDL